MIDSFGRTIRYLRISVTEECDLCCRYCTPAHARSKSRNSSLMEFDEILEVVRAAAELGFNKIRLTGGEPLMRPRLVDLVREISGIRGIRDFAMTSNGQLLAQHAFELAQAGLHRVNVSLDAIDPARYRWITRGGEIEPVLRGLEAARNAGLAPVKINCVFSETPDEPDARNVARFAAAEGLEIRFIRRMDLQQGLFYPILGGNGGDCPRCDRLRLTASGAIRPCLFGEMSFSVRQLGVQQALRLAVNAKPSAGTCFGDPGMYAVGG